jgi:hypothetical protein
MIVSLISWLLGSSVGRWVLFASSAVVVVMVSLYAAMAVGRKAEQARQVKHHVKVLTNQLKASDEISNLSDDARRAYVRKWLRDS